MSRLLSRSHTFAIIVILYLKIHQSMWIHRLFFPKTWTQGHWPLDDLWPHVCWGHVCDCTQGSLCPSLMTIHQCMWIQWSILQNTTYIHILRTYYIHPTYRMSDHIVSYWTQFRRDKNHVVDGRWRLEKSVDFHCIHIKWPSGVPMAPCLFSVHFTTFACDFWLLFFSNCLTIGYTSFDAKKLQIDPVVFSLISIN